MHCGKYVRQLNANDYIELRSGSIAYLDWGGIGTQGTWYYVGAEVAIHIRWEGQAIVMKLAVYGKTLTDQNGVVWVKQ